VVLHLLWKRMRNLWGRARSARVKVADGPQHPDAADAAKPVAAGSTDGPAVSGESVVVGAAPIEVYGLAAMTRLDTLQQLRLHTSAGGQSSYDRDTGGPSLGNHDLNNFLYVAGGEKVMLDQIGPGTVYRIWVTGFNAATDWIKVYFDGGATPRVNMMLRDLFSGTKSPFLTPLVADNTRSSGGYVCYLPMPYQTGVKITTNMSGYYNVGFHTYRPDAQVTTWTGTEDSTAVRAAWNNAGTDPKDTAGNTAASGGVMLRPGGSQTLVDLAGPRSVSSVKIRIPGVTPARTVADSGRAHRGFSQFTMAINPGNSGVSLVRRMDYGIADQRARVLVNGAYAGDWFDSGSDSNFRWRDSSFDIPPAMTTGKSSIVVKVQFVSSAIDWNEFAFWAYSQMGGKAVLTDTMDVANASSESQHGYVINTQTWSGAQSFVYPSRVTDTGRAHTGSSNFWAAIDPNNSGVVLVRRMDYGVANQKAAVFVDGSSAGIWEDPGADSRYRWRDSTFVIPPALTAGKSSATITVEFVSSAVDWNEYTYRAYSTVAGDVVLTDTLDIGDPASEAAHGYAVTGQTWAGSLAAGYDTAEILNNTRIRMSWDGEAVPSVDAPLGSFFGMGEFGAYATRALPVGIDQSDTLYLYLPMPFQNRAVIELASSRAIATTGISYEIAHRTFTEPFSGVGYLRTRFTITPATVIGRDIPILDTVGSGNFVGVTASYAGNTSRFYLEGDERIYVDGDATPALHGTGSEDFFNGGFYFDRGPYSQPMSGNTAHIADATTDRTAAYRFFLQDVIPFRERIVVSIEHGGHNETTTAAWMLAYYYQQPTPHLTLADTLDVGKAASESAHAYSISGPTWSGSRTYQYEGTADTVDLTDDGRAHKGFSHFVLALNPANNGVVLRRRLDYGIANQQAAVFVDGTLVGSWYLAGSNRFRRWRDSDFLIPPTFTAGRNRITVKIQFASSIADWNEFLYRAYSVMS
jgi:hypothetical protein